MLYDTNGISDKTFNVAEMVDTKLNSLSIFLKISWKYRHDHTFYWTPGYKVSYKYYEKSNMYITLLM